MAVGTRCSFLCISAMLVLASGCVTPATYLSTIRWNLQRQPIVVTTHDIHRGLELAKRSPDELECMMQRCPPPCVADLVGRWHGINRGLGAAMAGFHQDVKVLECSGGKVVGFNILVEQVPVEELASRGWQPKTSMRDCEPKTMGNFEAVRRCNHRGSTKLELDYILAQNPLSDPSRFLVDEIVEVQPGLLLGRASIKTAMLEMPLAYFVLMRAPD